MSSRARGRCSFKLERLCNPLALGQLRPTLSQDSLVRQCTTASLCTIMASEAAASMIPAHGHGVSDMAGLNAALPKQEVPDVTMVAPPAKPDAMDQSFWESLSSHFPADLIAYMASENIHSLEDLACYMQHSGGTHRSPPRCPRVHPWAAEV